MAPSARPYADADAWKVRGLLREAFLLHDRWPRAWHVARFDYARAHVCPNVGGVGLHEVATVWSEAEEVVGLVLPDGGPGEAHLAVHPRHRSRDLLHEMVDVAERRLATPGDDGRPELTVWAHAEDDILPELLRGRGYAPSGLVETQWRRRLDDPVATAPVAPGYRLRSLGEGLDLLERCYASGLAFHDADVAVAVDNRSDPSWYLGIQQAPLYRRDLDVVAEAPEGAIAAFCTLWFDDTTRSVYVEPLATVPEHRRKGLAQAVLTEGLRRAQRLGAEVALVGTYGDAANALYASVLGPAFERYEAWARRG